MVLQRFWTPVLPLSPPPSYAQMNIDLLDIAGTWIFLYMSVAKRDSKSQIPIKSNQSCKDGKPSPFKNAPVHSGYAGHRVLGVVV